jgi:hypothetical protein
VTKILFLLMALCIAPFAVAGVNKCVAADGKITYTDSPCPDIIAEKPASVPPQPAVPPAVALKPKPSQPYRPGQSQFTDMLLKATTAQCAQGVAESCTYAARIRAGNYGFGEVLVDTAEAGCQRGDQSECTRLCALDDTRAWCVRRRAAVPPGQNWYLTEVRTSTYYKESFIFCILPGQSSKVATGQSRLRISEEGGRIRDTGTSARYPTFNDAATAACMRIIEQSAKKS